MNRIGPFLLAAGLLCGAALIAGCATGRVDVTYDYASGKVLRCEASGLAVGRAFLACDPNQWHGIDPSAPDAKVEVDHETFTAAGAIHGGTGSAGWWAALGAGIGALAALLPLAL